MSKSEGKDSSKNDSASNYSSKKTSLIQVAEAFQLQAAQLESKTAEIPIQRILNPHFDPVTSALQQCKIQNQTLNSPKSPQEMLQPSTTIKQTNTIRCRSIHSRNQGSIQKRNQRERNRVHTVNQAFHVLKSNLPSLKTSTKRVSKLRILKAAINYIYTLTDHIDGVIDPHTNYSPISSSNVSSGTSPINLNNPVITSSSSTPPQQSLQFSTIGTQNSTNQTINSKQPNDSSLSSLISQIPITSQQQPATFLNFPAYLDYQEMATYMYRTNLHT